MALNALESNDAAASHDKNPAWYVNRTIQGGFLTCGYYLVLVGADFPMVLSEGGDVADGRTGVLRIKLLWTVEKLESPHGGGVLSR